MAIKEAIESITELREEIATLMLWLKTAECESEFNEADIALRDAQRKLALVVKNLEQK